MLDGFFSKESCAIWYKFAVCRYFYFLVVLLKICYFSYILDIDTCFIEPEASSIRHISTSFS